MFGDKAILYRNAVVLTVEMDKARIDAAPSQAASLAVHGTYNHLYTEPIEHVDGRLTCGDDAKCLPFFAAHDGCSICVAVCPFNLVGYERLHTSILASVHRQVGTVAPAPAGVVP